jgi:hypothetical protein
MPVRDLNLIGTGVRDLSPLKDAPLINLNLSGTPVSDLEALRGLPLKRIILSGCKNLTDLSPLCDCQSLEVISLPPEATNLECLRKLPKLIRLIRTARIGPRPAGEENLTSAEFWKEYDGRHKRP